VVGQQETVVQKNRFKRAWVTEMRWNKNWGSQSSPLMGYRASD